VHRRDGDDRSLSPGGPVRRSRNPGSREIATTALYTNLEKLFCEEPPRYPGRLVFFAAEASRHRSFLDRRLHWSKAAEHGLEVHLMPGDHNEMVLEPHVRKFPAVLQGCLERARVNFLSDSHYSQEFL
jgi:thioesterase domain-containing protein